MSTRELRANNRGVISQVDVERLFQASVMLHRRCFHSGAEARQHILWIVDKYCCNTVPARHNSVALDTLERYADEPPHRPLPAGVLTFLNCQCCTAEIDESHQVPVNGNDEDGHPTIEYRDGIKKRNLLNFNSHLYMIEVSIFHVRDAQHGVTIASWAAIYTFIRHSHFFHSLPCQTGSWLHSHSAVYRRM